MTAIGVGQGESILLISPTGRTLRMDAGGLAHCVHSDLDIGEDVVSPYLWSRAISHPGRGGRHPRLCPPRGRCRTDESLVMQFALGQTAVLLEGDAERRSEERIPAERPQGDLLKVAHHGTSTSTIARLLAAMHPRYAAISLGARNSYGHPRGEVPDRLAEAHVLTYRADLDGAVSFCLAGKTVSPCPPDFR